MSHAFSLSTKKSYGIQRVCEVWNIPRSTLYWRKTHGKSTARRGPKGFFTDAALLQYILEELRQSPFHGEGYRKIHARLRNKEIRTSPKRTMRIMRENNLQATRRVGRPRGPKNHDGVIKTKKINEMWGTDMATTLTTDEGTASIFFAIDHCSLELIGIHAASRGTRFEALEPLRQGIAHNFGIYEKNTALGLSIRHDHGSQFISSTFQSELHFLGIKSSPSYVREPQGNGIAERFVRTLKENLLWVQYFTTVEELRLALLDFKEKYNTQWLIGRHGYKTPAQFKALQLAALVNAA